MGVSVHADVRERLLKIIDEATAPDKMTDLLGDLGAEIEVRLECLQEEMANEAENG